MKDVNTKTGSRQISARLRAEAKAPFRGLRHFFYLAFAVSGALGVFIFALKLVAGEPMATGVPNLLLQLGVVALMVGLWRWDQPPANP
ncbi:DUF3493 domain-containing protein [Synechococcales cyanobacterium C]|uniref:DUF3493 domain-containing protein n=1 Tax=Petrachloros mirabilis ULC683 TaxID=2781853 RepID=A0A8K1ZX98_9CYAN|nr:DUF3493 domain-containing protein [Petrachloros mirabilis]NCJ05711.1 DUF3493 domain-containing protein [Petrachloros mirabilis ULC683]